MSNKENLSNMLMQQAQKMQEMMQKAQKELELMVVVGEAGLGVVKVEMTGRHATKRVSIDESVMSDKEMLEDLIAAANNDAVRKIEKETRTKMGSITAGMNLPPDFKLPTE
jgi:hypothetical protein